MIQGAPPKPQAVAGVAELVDARDLGSRDESRGGSSPSARTSWAGFSQKRPGLYDVRLGRAKSNASD